MFNREFGYPDPRDGFAADCLHRQIYSLFQSVRKLRVCLEQYAILVSPDQIANLLITGGLQMSAYVFFLFSLLMACPKRSKGWRPERSGATTPLYKEGSKLNALMSLVG